MHLLDIQAGDSCFVLVIINNPVRSSLGLTLFCDSGHVFKILELVLLVQRGISILKVFDAHYRNILLNGYLI